MKLVFLSIYLPTYLSTYPTSDERTKNFSNIRDIQGTLQDSTYLFHVENALLHKSSTHDIHDGERKEKRNLKNEHQQRYVTFDMMERACSTIPLAFGSGYNRVTAYLLIGGLSRA